MSWIQNLQTMMASSQSCRNLDVADDIASLKTCVVKADKRYDNHFEMESKWTILADLKQAGRRPSIEAATLPRMPDAALVELFPGADHVEMLADALVSIADVWAPKRQAVIAPQSMVIFQQTCIIQGLKIPFTMGTVVAPLELDGKDDVIVQWWVPPLAKERVAGGRHRITTDLFGSWFPLQT